MTRTLIGAAIAAFGSMAVVFLVKTMADAAFLAEYGPEYVPHFFVAEAVALVSTSALYGAIIRRGTSVIVDVALLLALGLTALATPLALDYGGGGIFLISLALVALSSLANLAVWNAATGVVRGRQARVFLPRASAAATAGAVVGGFGSSAVVATTGVAWLGPVASAIVAVLIILQVILLRIGFAQARGRSAASWNQERAIQHATSGLTRRLVRYITWAAVTAAILAAVIDFGFKIALSGRYTRDELGLFFSLFYGGSNICILIMQLFITTRLLSAKSLRVTLSIEPLAILGSALAWFVLPILPLTVLARASEGVMKFGLSRPAQEVALMPLSQQQRQRSKVLVRGVYAQGGSAFAGIVLIVAGTAFIKIPYITPLVAALLAMVCLFLQRRIGILYLDTLGSTLGMGRLSVRGSQEPVILDRDGLGRVIELLGDSDPSRAKFGREILSTIPDTALLAPYLTRSNERARRALYERLSQLPSAECVQALRHSVKAEDSESEALAAGFDALAACGDTSLVHRARELANVLPEQATGVACAAWRYLGQVGALDDDPACYEKVLHITLENEGVRSVAIHRAALQRGRANEDAFDAAVIEAMKGPAAREAFNAAAALGRFKPLTHLLRAIESNSPGAEPALAHIDSEALSRLVMLMNAREIGAHTRARILRGLRSNELPEVADIAAEALFDEDEVVRDIAVRTLIHRMRDPSAHIPQAPIESALGRALKRFSAYVNARPAYPSDARESSIAFRHDTPESINTEVFFLDELERRTEQELTKVCEILALLGTPAVVFAAARELGAPTLKRRLRAMDILQEIAPSAQRDELFALLERYLHPQKPTEEALEAVCKVDSWLARCRSAELAQIRRRLSGLRAAPLFDKVRGEALVGLAESSTEQDVKKGQTVVQQGEPGDALYIILSGRLTVERDGVEIARLVAGQTFGELALVDGKARQASVRALTDGRLLRLPRKPFSQALAEHQEIRLGLVRCLAAWLRTKN